PQEPAKSNLPLTTEKPTIEHNHAAAERKPANDRPRPFSHSLVGDQPLASLAALRGASYSAFMSSAADCRSQVLEGIATAARLARRDPADVQLIAVTKGRSADEIEALIAAGQRDFGENRVQEALGKWPP